MDFYELIQHYRITSYNVCYTKLLRTLINRSNEQINNRMYLLSIIAALFLPLSFFTGLLGVNLSGIPHAESQNAFMAFVIILLLVVAFQIWFFRKNRWL